MSRSDLLLDMNGRAKPGKGRDEVARSLKPDHANLPLFAWIKQIDFSPLAQPPPSANTPLSEGHPKIDDLQTSLLVSE